jgi:5-methyltetrahydropteroyltriglutamate--homocysteine methyltransferase
MPERVRPPFRADHVGSLLRPKELTRAFRRHRAGEIGDAAFAAIQDEAVAEAIAMQEAAGLQSITDGEFRRASYWSRFVERVAGLEVREALFTFRDEHGHGRDFTAPHAAGKVAWAGPVAGDEFEFIRAHTGRTPKITLPSPPSMHFWRLGAGVERAAYADDGAYFADLARVYAAEIADLADRGATYVQIDDVPFAMLCDPDIRERVADDGFDPDRLIGDYIGLCNSALGGRPKEVTAAFHICRGNYKGHFLSQGGYDDIAERLFDELRVDAFFLEYDTPRAGDFAPLRFVPKDRIVVLGLVSSKSPEMEDPDGLKRRIDAAAAHVDLGQLALSPQCGFASTVAGNPVTPEIQKAKLELVVRTAADVWG